MKRTNKISVTVQKQASDSDVDMDCSCQILYDTSLSNVGDSQCDCSDCLEANLNAFNEFKNQQPQTQNTTKQNIKKNRGKQTHSANKTRKQSQTNIHRYKSTERLGPEERKTRKKWGVRAQNQEGQEQQFDEYQSRSQFTNGQLNDFLLITKYRTRKYLEETKKLQENEKQQKDQLRDKIKKNLELLKYTTEMIMDENQPNKKSQNEKLHKYNWNHSKYKCECNGKDDQRQPNHQCCRKIKVKSQLNTNLGKLKQNFADNRDTILEQRKKKRQKQIEQKQKARCPHDNCPDHHNRTDKQKIAQIQKFIENNVKKYHQQQKKKKKKQLKQDKVKEAKLRAIDIKSKQILSRSKKVDDTISKTSFKLSIDQFDTFSELRQENQRRNQMKQNQRQVRKNLKMGGGQLQNKMYEVLEEEDEYYEQNAGNLGRKTQSGKSKNVVIDKKTKAEAPQYREQQQIYDRIAYDAQIKAPKNLKKNPLSKKTEQIPKNPLQDSSKRQSRLDQKKTKNLSKGKEEQKKRKLEQEIQRKKKQILEQYKKRNSNKPSNKQLRKQYQQKLNKLQKQKANTRIKAERDQPRRDPYKTNYQTKAGKNVDQVRVHGDPLLQQYTYHQNQDQAKRSKGDNMGIFTENIHTLKGKTHLKP